MPYDDQLSPEQQEEQHLVSQLGDKYANDPSLSGVKQVKKDAKDDEEGKTDEDTEKRRKWRKKDKEREKSEDEKLNDRLSGGLYKAHDEDMAAKGKNKDSRDYKKVGGGLRGLLKRRKLRGGIAIAVIGLLLSGFTLFSFLNVFKLDHILQNIDASTFAKFNASFSNRSDKYLKAYINLRLSEIEGTRDHDTLLFRANRVDSDNPIKDWYRTLRTSSFEKKLFEDKGIRFQSIAVQNDAGEITLRPAKISFDSRPDLFQQFEATMGGKSISNRKYRTSGAFDTDLAKFIGSLDAESKNAVLTIFDRDQDARRDMRRSTQDSTKFFQVLKRRHVRKDIRNMTGISEWRFFETTRNKYTAKKVAVQRKLIKKVVPENQVGKFIACILGAGKCPSTNDPNAAENRIGGNFTGNTVAGDTSNTEQIGADGQPVTTTDDEGNTTNNTTPEYSAANTSSEITDNIGGLGDEPAGEGAADALTPNQALVMKQINGFIGNPYTKAWSFAKKLTAFHNNIINKVFVKIAKQARLQQLAGIAATFGIMRDQARTGQLTGEEKAHVMSMLSGGEHSEGWIKLNENRAGTVSAAEQVVQAANAEEYAKLSPYEQKKQPIQYFLDRPNDGNVERLTETYMNSFAFQIINPIAQVVTDVQNSVLGKFVDFIADTADSLLSKLTDPLIKAAIAITDSQDAIAKVMGLGMTKAMEFMGAGPIFDGTQAGALNFILAGSAVTAENSLRSSGGVKSTPQTTDRSRAMTAAYKNDGQKELSVFERYASVNNPDSVASHALFSISTFNFSKRVSSFFSSVASLPSSFVSIFSGRSYAGAADFNAAEWAGVDTYDIPSACLDLEPLLPAADYMNRAIGVVNDSAFAIAAQGIVDKIRPELTMALIRNDASFWDKVYGAIGTNPDAEDIAGAIYNCATFDQRVMGSMGYVNGYEDDNGYGATQ